MGLADGFQGVYSLGVFLSDLHDLSETAFADDLEQIERLYGQRLVTQLFEVNLQVEGARAVGSRVPLI